MKAQLILLLSLLPLFATATTMSYLESDIQPIAVNEKGEVLCKTRFAANSTGGGYAYDFVHYGFCVLSNDSIHHFRGIHLGWVEYYEDEKYAFWQAIYEKPPTDEKLTTIINEVLKGAFTFTELTAENYKVDKVMSKQTFRKNYQIDLDQKRQKALRGALSTKNSCQAKINVSYDFGSIILIKNESTCCNDVDDGDDMITTGCYISYFFETCAEWGGFCFDLYEIDGVVFKT